MAKRKEQLSWSALALGGAGLAVGAALGRLLARRSSNHEGSTGDDLDQEHSREPVGHVPTDLMQGHHPGPDDESIDAFKPDMSAPVPEEEREAYRPVTIPVS